MMATIRVGDLALPGVEAGSVYVLRGHLPADAIGDARATLHVISAHCGGEIRGFSQDGSGWNQRTPDYIGTWPEVDQALADLIGEAVTDSLGQSYRPKITQDRAELCPSSSRTTGRSMPAGGEGQTFLPWITLEPFWACSRVVSLCDGSRAGCGKRQRRVG